MMKERRATRVREMAERRFRAGGSWACAVSTEPRSDVPTAKRGNTSGGGHVPVGGVHPFLSGASKKSPTVTPVPATGLLTVAT